MEKTTIIEEIYRQNKHWGQESPVFNDIKNINFKRKLFYELLPYLPKKQVLSIVGLRRVGKTIILKQLIEHLISTGVNAKQILLLSFDEALLTKKLTLADYLNSYLKEIADTDKMNFIFLDEIQYSEKWQHIIKRYYDTEPNIKFIVSGSSSLFLKRKTTESLAGRIFEFYLPVLSFTEYLELTNVDSVLLNNYKKVGLALGQKEIKDMNSAKNFVNQSGATMVKYFEKYLLYGQFPEIANESDMNIVMKYLSESVYKKTIEYDIPRIFGVEKVQELKFLFQVLVNEVGSIIEIDNLAREIGLDKKTIKAYFEYLENSFLVYFIYNFSKSFRKSRRLSKKVYLSSANFLSVFHDFSNLELKSQYLGHLAENYFMLVLKNAYQYVSFKRIRRNEFNFLGADDLLDKAHYQYFEVKYGKNFTSRDLRFISKVAGKNNTRFLVAAKNMFEINPTYSVIPVWLFKN
ncbi:MAG: ATP-binding protein [Parcubacteria group bacterium]|nr:ATP-binding protein [Parcubacteria group bacterium]